MKTIKINIGDTQRKVYEMGLSPKSQVKKVKINIKKLYMSYNIYTNSPYIVEAFNKFGKEKGYNIICFYDNKKVDLEEVFDNLSKPFEELVFGDEEE